MPGPAKLPYYTRAGVITVVVIGAFIGLVVGLILNRNAVIILQNWQTFMAALVALGAAGIAYRAAMAKVAFDREIADRDLRRRKLGMLLRLESAIAPVFARLLAIESAFTWKFYSSRRTLRIEDMAMTEPDEFTEAWQNLDFFPLETIHDLRLMRHTLKLVVDEVKILGDGPFVIDTITVPTILQRYKQLTDDLRKSTKRTQASIEREIADIRTS